MATRARGLHLDTALQYLKGVGPRLAEVLASRGLFTIEDLLRYLPFRYEDRSHVVPIAQLRAGETATVVGNVRTQGGFRTRGGMSLFQMTVADETGTVECTWFNADYLRGRFAPEQRIALFGRVEQTGRRLTMRQPQFELLDAEIDAEAGDRSDGRLDSIKLGRIVPVYEAIGTITTARLRLLIYRALEQLPADLPEILPSDICARLGLTDRRTAYRQVHFPQDGTALSSLEASRTPAHFRLIFEELFYLQAGLELKRRRALRQPGIVMEVNERVRAALKKLLPFHPTSDQKRVLREIVDDMRGGHPMRRLMQGDVGSGKTIVALEAAVVAMENGWQVALMAPTQILATQHYLFARERLPDRHVLLVTGNAGASERRGRRAAIGSGEPMLIVGTHALIQGTIKAPRLGLVIVDEQHRFGVLQRFMLMSQGELPAHVLVMTATPIPRTLALSLYGDLDVSLIRELPPGRMPITTRVIPESRSAEIYAFVGKQLAAGRQAYFVYPLIEESETLDLKPALRMVEVLRSEFREYRVGLLHGRMPAEEKEAVMAAFKSGQVQLLVSTTVVEVGVDVPNANVMVIEQAERFGISQLHQLRGRVGRPQKGRKSGKSYCLLVTGGQVSDLARRKLEAVAASEDGFELAELDLKLRGPGEFFGTRQSGIPGFEVADPLRDQELMELARSEARGWLARATTVQKREIVHTIRRRWQRRYGLVEVG